MVDAWLNCTHCGYRYSAGLQQCPQCSKKNDTKISGAKMGRGKKIALIAGIIIGGWITINLALYFASPVSREAVDSFASQPISGIYEVKTDPRTIVGITNFFVAENGGVYQAYFSLQTRDAFYAADNINVKFVVKDATGSVVHSDSFDVKRADFIDFYFNAGGTAYVYAWNIPRDTLRQIADNDNIFTTPTADITVTLSDSRTLTASTDVF